MEKSLKLLYNKKDGTISPFPSDEEPIEISDFTYEASRMGGAPTIQAKVVFPRCLDNEWSNRVFTYFRGERYFFKRTPTSRKANTDERYEHDLILFSERYILDNTFFLDAVSPDSSFSDSASNSTSIQFVGDIKDFVARLNNSMKASSVGYDVVIDEGVFEDNKEERMVFFENKYLSEALKEIYNTFKIPYYFVGKTIHVGYAQHKISTHIQYGYDGGLLSVTKENANFKVINRISGVGSQDNIPYYYPNNSPKGEIDIETPITNTSLTKDNVFISNPSLFAERVRPSVPVVYSGFLPIYRGGFYKFSGDYVYKVYDQYNGTIDFGIKEGSSKEISVKHEYEFSSDGDIRIAVIIKNMASSNAVNYVRNAYVLYDDGTRVSCQPIKGNEIDFLDCRKGAAVIFFDVVVQYAGTNVYKMHFETRGVLSESWTYDGDKVNLEDLGISLRDESLVSRNDKIYQTIGRYITPSKSLMPSIYRNTNGVQRFYNAINKIEDESYKDIYMDKNGEQYVFENEYSPMNPLESFVQLEDVKPTIKNVTNARKQKIDSFIEFAYDENDSDNVDSEGNYIHPYFFAKLRKTDGDFAFNLFESVNEKQTMKISMTSGDCGACEFEVGVGETSKKNTVQVDEDGNLLRYKEGVHKGDVIISGTPQKWQNDTIKNEVWIALKKDTSTYSFHTPMPNAKDNLKPKAGDTFVILGITLPKSYILDAEKKLDKLLVENMYINNKEKFNFSISFSRIFLAEHQKDILEKLSENSTIVIEYNKQAYPLYVDSFIYKMSADDVLPDIRVNLTETLSIGKSQLESKINEVKRDILASYRPEGSSKENLKYFLRRDIPDRTKYEFGFDGGVEFGDFSRGSRGGHIDNAGNAEVESINVRGALTAMEYIINRIEAIEGDQVYTESDTIERVDDFGDGKTFGLLLRKKYDGYFTAQRENNIIKGVINDVLNGGGVRTSFMRVNFVDNMSNYINVTMFPDEEVPSKKNFPPCELMRIVRWGNQDHNQTDRQKIAYLSSLKERLSFLKNVETPTLNDWNYSVALGKLPDLKIIRDAGMSGTYGLYAESVLCEKFRQIDYNGDLVRNIVDRGVWSREVALSSSPYRYQYNEEKYEDGLKRTVLEQHVVHHKGCKWGCMTDKTTDEPDWNITSWVLLEGDVNYYLLFDSSKGWQFRVNNVDTIITVSAYIGNLDITDSIVAIENSTIIWKRDTGNKNLDNIWNQEHLANVKSKTLHLGNKDMGDGWCIEYNEVMFECEVTIPTEKETKVIKKNINIKV